MNSILSKSIIGILSVFAILYFGFQLYQFTYQPYQTVLADLYTYTDQVELDGIMVKQEQVIPQAKQGVIKYEYSNAKKVSENAVIATKYATEQDLLLDTQIAAINARVDLLKSVESQRTSASGNVQSIVANLEKDQIEILNQIHNNDFGDFPQRQNDFLSSLLKQQMLLTPDASFAGNIASLQAEAEALTAQMSGQDTSVNATISGYFTNEIDGYEASVTSAALENLSLEAVTALIKDTQPSNENNSSIGKIITSTEWNFIALVDTAMASRFREGDDIDLTFPNNATYKVAAKVVRVKEYRDQPLSVVALKSDIMNSEIINVRKEQPSAFFKSGRGLKVPSSAIRVWEGTTGVYVNTGQIVKFKRIDVDYETAEYSISKIHDGQDAREYLQQYDQIILEGKDLYDNKPV